jgi:UDP-N-acetylglucosamine 2-epimerase
MKILSVVGARPQFVKAALVSAEIHRRGLHEILVHTGQHYDYEMSQVFFDQLTLPVPGFCLEVGSGTHAGQTAEMMRRLEAVIVAENPSWVVVYGDTNTTLAAALVASKLTTPLAHVEAGLRSFNKAMPEEINRIVADHVADMLFVPNQRAADQLASEGIAKGVRIVGDLMVDSVMRLVENRSHSSRAVDRFGVAGKEYAVVTVHRASNTDDPLAFGRIVQGLRQIPMPVIFPVHPRTASSWCLNRCRTLI